MFKVGDRVRLKWGDPQKPPFPVGIVVEIKGDTLLVKYDHYDEAHHFLADNFDLVEEIPFKVGDSVKVKSGNALFDKATVHNIDNSSRFSVWVKFDRDLAICSYAPSQLELINSDSKFKIGDKVKTVDSRGGVRAGIIEVFQVMLIMEGKSTRRAHLVRFGNTCEVICEDELTLVKPEPESKTDFAPTRFGGVYSGSGGGGSGRPQIERSEFNIGDRVMVKGGGNRRGIGTIVNPRFTMGINGKMFGSAVRAIKFDDYDHPLDVPEVVFEEHLELIRPQSPQKTVETKFNVGDKAYLEVVIVAVDLDDPFLKYNVKAPGIVGSGKPIWVSKILSKKDIIDD